MNGLPTTVGHPVEPNERPQRNQTLRRQEPVEALPARRKVVLRPELLVRRTGFEGRREPLPAPERVLHGGFLNSSVVTKVMDRLMHGRGDRSRCSKLVCPALRLDIEENHPVVHRRVIPEAPCRRDPIVLTGKGGEVEIVTDNGGGPFEAPALSNFTNPGNGETPAADWNAVFDDANMIHAAGPASTVALAFDIHLSGSVSGPVTFQGVAFLNGVMQFSATFVWTGDGTFSITDENMWNPDPGSLPGLMVPLPAAVWMGSLGLLGVMVIRRKLLK